MSIRDDLVEKLADNMDRDNAAEFVDRAIAAPPSPHRTASLRRRHERV
jgi:hypothetical protein